MSTGFPSTDSTNVDGKQHFHIPNQVSHLQIKHTILHPQLVESMYAKGCLQSQKLYVDYQLYGGQLPLTPTLFKGQLYIMNKSVDSTVFYKIVLTREKKKIVSRISFIS